MYDKPANKQDKGKNNTSSADRSDENLDWHKTNPMSNTTQEESPTLTISSPEKHQNDYNNQIFLIFLQYSTVA